MCARNLTKEDVAVIFSYSGLTREMLTCARVLKEQNVPIITVTRFGENDLTRLADCKLYMRTAGEDSGNRIQDIPAEYHRYPVYRM